MKQTHCSALWQLWFAVALCLVTCRAAQAHSMFQAALLLDYHAQSIDLELQLPASRLEKVFGHVLTESTLPSFRSELSEYLQSRIHARSLAGSSWTVQLSDPPKWELIDGAPYVVAHFHLTPSPGVSVRRFVLENDVITDSLPSQVVLVSIRSDWAGSTFANEPEMIGVLNGQERSLEVDRSTGNWAHGFESVFHLGVRHIAEGTDHLLFLLALLLPAPLLYRNGHWAAFADVRHAFLQILRVVTAFTVGHSLTLAMAASELVRVPGKPIEVLIAVSILISAIHAMRPLFPGREAFIAGGFGLIHGLAFASTLAELGLYGWERVTSISAFNVGIEAMQILVVLCVMPSLILLSRTTVYKPFRWCGAIFAGVAACGWIIERVTGHSLAVDRAVDSLARHSSLSVSILFCASAVISWWQRRSTLARSGHTHLISEGSSST